MIDSASQTSSKRVLEPIERISEVSFGLILVLAFTGSFSVAQAGHSEMRKMLLGALGCNFVWGVIDGLRYLLGCLAEKGRGLAALRAARKATDPEKGRRLLARLLPPLFAGLADTAEFEAWRQQLLQSPEPAARPSLHKADWLRAAGVFLLIFVSTFPVAVPFLTMQNPLSALRLSNGIALLMLLLAGYSFGRCAGYRPAVMGIIMASIGAILVSITMALGG